jgi:DNA-binding NarL/FixJ family response regulator
VADYQRGRHGIELATACLSRVECDILARSSRGHSVPEIARELGVSTQEVRAALTAAMYTLGARSRLEAVLIAARQDVIQP